VYWESLPSGASLSVAGAVYTWDNNDLYNYSSKKPYCHKLSLRLSMSWTDADVSRQDTRSIVVNAYTDDKGDPKTDARWKLIWPTLAELTRTISERVIPECGDIASVERARQSCQQSLYWSGQNDLLALFPDRDQLPVSIVWCDPVVCAEGLDTDAGYGVYSEGLVAFPEGNRASYLDVNWHMRYTGGITGGITMRGPWQSQLSG
jgi:hypothetical protein